MISYAYYVIDDVWNFELQDVVNYEDYHFSIVSADNREYDNLQGL